MNGNLEKYTPENVGTNFYNCWDNFLVTDKYIIYGSTSFCVYILSKNLSLKKTVFLKSKFNHINKKPIIYKNLIILSSDSEIIAINSETLEEVWKISSGSFTQPVIYNDILFLGNKSFLSFFSLQAKEKEAPQKIGEIFFGSKNFISFVFSFENSIFVFDIKGNVFLVNYLTKTFHKCNGSVQTKYPPLIIPFKKELFVCVVNKYNDLEIFSLEKNQKILEEKQEKKGEKK